MVDQPIVIRVRGDVRAFVGIGAEVEDEGHTQRRGERFSPDSQGTRRPLLGKHEFPVVITQSHQAGFIVEIEKFGSRTFLFADRSDREGSCSRPDALCRSCRQLGIP